MQAAIFGFGTIGSGVAEVLTKNREQIARAIPGGIDVKYILDIRDFPDSPFADLIVHDIDIILSDPEIKVICETMGGKEPANTFTHRALEKGISVCTSNKELVEAYGPSLLAEAAAHNCSYLFEASVGGGIPLISTLLHSFSQEKIMSVTGILNGTTNYILTKMQQEGSSYEDALKEAQALGYAERDPKADVEGHDAGRKISILSSLVCRKTVRFDDICVEGISGISAEDFCLAGQKGYTIKLIGRASFPEEEGAAPEVITAPFLIPKGHPLYDVNDVFNGILITGNMVDRVMLYGRGAGKCPTASAVVSDMILAAENAGKNLPVEWDPEVLSPAAPGDSCYAFYVRAAQAAGQAFRKAFEGCIADQWDDAFLTEKMREENFKSRLKTAGDVLSWIRILPEA